MTTEGNQIFVPDFFEGTACETASNWLLAFRLLNIETGILLT